MDTALDGNRMPDITTRGIRNMFKIDRRLSAFIHAAYLNHSHTICGMSIGNSVNIWSFWVYGYQFREKTMDRRCKDGYVFFRVLQIRLWVAVVMKSFIG